MSGLSNGENADVWDRAVREVNASGDFAVGVQNDGPADSDEDGFWDAVEARCLELGGTPPGPQLG